VADPGSDLRGCGLCQRGGGGGGRGRKSVKVLMIEGKVILSVF